MTGPTRPRYEIRPFREDDRQQVERLIDAALEVGPGGVPPSRFFAWKHMDSPFGRALLLVAEAGGDIVGFRAFMRWLFVAGGRTLRAVRAVDTATDARYRGLGIFSGLTKAALDLLRGEADLVFNTPNRASGPGYLKLGWRRVGNVPLGVRVRRPVRFLRGVRRASGRDQAQGLPSVRAGRAAEALVPGEGLSGLLRRSTPPSEARIATPKDITYLRWRYTEAPVLDYRAVSIEGNGGPAGAAIFRVRPRGPLWEASVAELLVPTDDVATGVRLLRLVGRAASVDHVLTHFPAGTTGALAARRAGFLRAKVGPELMVKPLRPDVEPDPTLMSSWALSLGELEVF